MTLMKIRNSMPHQLIQIEGWSPFIRITRSLYKRWNKSMTLIFQDTIRCLTRKGLSYSVESALSIPLFMSLDLMEIVVYRLWRAGIKKIRDIIQLLDNRIIAHKFTWIRWGLAKAKKIGRKVKMDSNQWPWTFWGLMISIIWEQPQLREVIKEEWAHIKNRIKVNS